MLDERVVSSLFQKLSLVKIFRKEKLVGESVQLSNLWQTKREERVHQLNKTFSIIIKLD